MANPIDRICDELEVCREEALCYLEGFQWNFDSALEACRNQTLPLSSLAFESSPVNEKLASNTPSTLPLMIDSGPSWNPPVDQSRNQSIAGFCEVLVGASVEEARAYLERNNWNIDLAVDSFWVERRQTPSQKKSNPLQLVSKSQFQDYSKPLKIGSSSSEYGFVSYMFLGSMEVDSRGEHIPEVVPLMASSQVKNQNIQELRSVWPPEETWVDRILPEVSVSEASAEAPPNLPVQLSQFNNERISSFSNVVGGATREEAIDCLKLCNWDVDQAVGFYMDRFSKDLSMAIAMSSKDNRGLPLPSQSQFQASLGYFKEGSTSSSMEVDPTESERSLQGTGEENHAVDGFSEHELSAAIANSLKESREVPLPSIELPSQSQFQASLGYLKEGSTSSLMEVDPTESERSLEEAGKENAAVAILGMASSQVDGEGVEKDSSMETFPDPVAYQDRIIVGPRAAGTTITITIVLADGRLVNIPFRPNQTVRDIRDAIDELTPDFDKDYILQSGAAVDYMDPDITVHEISTGDTTLLQIYL
ncbi:unnamed protein product [Arabidopsis arenosa]|uniref:Uncharacterized protein n=1 Tax=Arabidopsis arenosa TaxID=38785 RepID=A0A8S2A5N6_ARAAE|nr:unnamed protein product [Arabidopsis arenosa]